MRKAARVRRDIRPAMDKSASADARLKPKDEARRFFTFAAVGAATFGVDAALLQAGLMLGMTMALARAVSLFLAMNFSFAVNRAVTFARFRGAPLPRQWVMFMAANTIGAIINYLVSVALGTGQGWLAGAPILAAGVGAIAGLGFNFTASRLTAFRT